MKIEDSIGKPLHSPCVYVLVLQTDAQRDVFADIGGQRFIAEGPMGEGSLGDYPEINWGGNKDNSARFENMV